MVLSDISVPESYTTSADFRFFLKWFEYCLTKVQIDTENLIDLLDPLRCPSDLLWMLADTCGFKYDERVSVAVNRLILLNFALLIRNRGSETGITYAAEVNLAQLNLNKYAKENEILNERLEDTSVPVNSVSVMNHVDEGFIDIVYASEELPVDACVEYVRPLGMYCFFSPGVQVNARTKISVDARLTNSNDRMLDFGPSFIAHYRRSDYASIQKGYVDTATNRQVPTQEREKAYYRNKKYEEHPDELINPGYRTLYSLQLCNNEHTVKALLPSLDEYDEIFSLGFGPQDVDVSYPDDYLKHPDKLSFNLRVDKNLEESFTPQVYTVESAKSVTKPKPAVNTIMSVMGDAIPMDSSNSKYTKRDPVTGEIIIVNPT